MSDVCWAGVFVWSSHEALIQISYCTTLLESMSGVDSYKWIDSQQIILTSINQLPPIPFCVSSCVCGIHWPPVHHSPRMPERPRHNVTLSSSCTVLIHRARDMLPSLAMSRLVRTWQRGWYKCYPKYPSDLDLTQRLRQHVTLSIRLVWTGHRGWNKLLPSGSDLSELDTAAKTKCYPQYPTCLDLTQRLRQNVTISIRLVWTWHRG